MSAIDPTEYRTTLGTYPTGVVVITGATPEGPVGVVIGSFTSVSLDPPLVGFLPGKSSTSWPKIEATGRFCVVEESWLMIDPFVTSFPRGDGIGDGVPAACADGASGPSTRSLSSGLYRRPRNFTGSADPFSCLKGARGLRDHSRLPPVGNCTPP